jgi:putative membrane protein
VAEIPIQRKPRRNIWPVLIGLLVLLAVLWYLFYRRPHANDATAARADSTSVASNGAVTSDSANAKTANGMAAGATASPTGTGSNAGTSSSSGTLSDADITSVIHEVNAGEIAAGKLASTKATNNDVKSFARDMVKDHSAMDGKDEKLASGGASSSAADSVTKANTATSEQLKSAGSGAAFDKAYIDAQVTGHENALAFLQRAQTSAQSADLKKLVAAAIPDVQKHLDRARSLQSKIGQ